MESSLAFISMLSQEQKRSKNAADSKIFIYLVYHSVLNKTSGLASFLISRLRNSPNQKAKTNGFPVRLVKKRKAEVTWSVTGDAVPAVCRTQFRLFQNSTASFHYTFSSGRFSALRLHGPPIGSHWPCITFYLPNWKPLANITLSCLPWSLITTVPGLPKLFQSQGLGRWNSLPEASIFSVRLFAFRLCIRNRRLNHSIDGLLLVLRAFVKLDR